MPDLIRFIHKNPIGINRITRVFRTHWGAKMSQSSSENPPRSPVQPTPNPTIQAADKLDVTPKGTRNPAQFQEFESLSGISQRQMDRKIKAIAVKEVRLPIMKPVWYVHSSILKQHGLEQEDFTPLMQDASGSPLLCEKTVEQLTPSSATKPSESPPDSGKSAGRGVKRKPNSVGKSLLQFLVPAGKTTLIPSPKRPKIVPPQEGGSDDVIIVGSSSLPVVTTTTQDTVQPVSQATARPPSQDTAKPLSQDTARPPSQDTAEPLSQATARPPSQDTSEPMAKKPRLAIPSPTVKDISSTNDILQDSTNSLTNKNLKTLLLSQEPITIM